QGEKSDADEKKSDKSKPGKEVVKIRAYIKAVNDGRRIFNLDEVKSIMLADVPYDEMELYEIAEVRQHQKSLYEEKINGLQELMCDLYAQLGLCFLGRDRTYRTYYFLEAIPIVLVEEPTSIPIGECEQPTPLQLKQTNETNNNLDEERIRRLACTGLNQTCPIHGASRSFPRWSYLNEKGTVDKLLEACNRRGFREMELADNITNIRQTLSKTIDEQISTLSEEEILNHLALSPSPEEFPVENIFQDLEREIRAMILDLEEKIETRAIGRIECATDRETWRDSLEQTGDTTAYCFKNEVRIKYTSKDAEPVFKGEQLSELDSIAKLTIALLQLAQGIKLECLNPPFTQEKDKKDPKVLPSTTFVNWQQELLSSKSISRIALLFNTLEMAIEWTQLRGQGNKCKICHKRGNIENLAQCRDCDRCYHTTCAKFKIPKLYDWQCPDCVEAEKIKQSKKKGRRLRDELEQHRGMNDVYEDDMNSDVGAGSSHENGWSDSKEKNYSLRGSRKRGETSDRKSDTRDDRKRRATARTSYINYFEKDDSYSDASSGDFSRKRRKTAENLNIRALSMGLRESDSSEIKRQLQLCEEIVRATMHHECGLPFTDPVNLKEYPDYVEVIKYPMDLRKIMSKLKYFEYDTAGQVWDDFKLIFDNCRAYNDEDSELHEYADTLQSFVAEKFRKGFGMKV
uniref:Bromodomain adjacent to zinc finger domain protein 1A n=1 Tax=Acrobeloides nanus TaxID=290746 RepID=A0A914EA30_9BILA